MTFGWSAQTWEQPPTHTKAQLEVHIKTQKEIHVWRHLKLHIKVHTRVHQWVHLKNEGIICILTDYAFLGGGGTHRGTPPDTALGTCVETPIGTSVGTPIFCHIEPSQEPCGLLRQPCFGRSLYICLSLCCCHVQAHGL